MKKKNIISKKYHIVLKEQHTFKKGLMVHFYGSVLSDVIEAKSNMSIRMALNPPCVCIFHKQKAAASDTEVQVGAVFTCWQETNCFNCYFKPILLPFCRWDEQS